MQAQSALDILKPYATPFSRNGLLRIITRTIVLDVDSDMIVTLANQDRKFPTMVQP
jgi:hypothetical protein